MHVDDVGADGHVHRNRDRKPIGVPQQTDLFVRRVLLLEKRAHRFSNADLVAGTGSDGFVQQRSRFFRHPELAVPEAVGHFLRRLAHHR